MYIMCVFTCKDSNKHLLHSCLTALQTFESHWVKTGKENTEMMCAKLHILQHSKFFFSMDSCLEYQIAIISLNSLWCLSVSA